MLKFLRISLIIFATLLSNAAHSQKHETGVLHVKLKESSITKVKAAKMNEGKFGLKEVDDVSQKLNVSKVKRIFRQSGKFEEAHKRFGLHLWYEIRIDKNKDLNNAINEFVKTKHFEKVEAYEPYHRFENSPREINNHSESALTGPANDPSFSSQWHYKNTGQSGGTLGADIDLEPAWQIQTGSSDVIVAVIDGGIDITHPDLAQALWVNQGEIPDNNIDDDMNGYIDDVNGYSFGDDDGTLYPDEHGTHVAGTIGAVTNNGIGVSGIAGGSGSANGVRLMSCAGFGEFGVSGFEDAMVYAADNGAVISQNSWGGGPSSIEAAIDYFIARAGYDNSNENFSQNIQIGPMAGGIVIFSAGNNNSAFAGIYPASYAPVMAVAATDRNDHRASFSNYGSWVDIAAPGQQVYSTRPGNQYGNLNGTSMACPHVSGVAALIISELGGPSFYPGQVWDILQSSADNINALNPSYVNLLGAGRLNAYRALTEASDQDPPASIADLFVVEEKLTSVVLRWTATGASGNTGTASFYDLRYSNTPIDATNFDQATHATIVKKPSASGVLDQIEVSDLIHNTQYYFALKAGDVSGNLSEISNIVTATTLQPPVIEAPVSLSATLGSGESTMQYLTISNIGVSDLIFHPFPGITAHAPQSIPSNAKLFAADTDAGSINQIDPVSGIIIHQIPIPNANYNGSEIITFDGLYLYYYDGVSIYRLNPDTGEVLSQLALAHPSDAIRAITCSDKFLYAYEDVEQLILEIDFATGKIIRSMNAPIASVVLEGGLTYYAPGGTLLMSSSNSIVELNIQTGAIIRTIPIAFNEPTNFITSLAYSTDNNLLYAINNNVGTIEVIDIDFGLVLQSSPLQYYTPSLAANAPGSWCLGSSLLRTIPSGESLELPVLLDASNLMAGNYTTTLTILSNDPLTPAVEISVSLEVDGQPDIDIENELIDFGSVYANSRMSSFISISNIGTDQLTITEINSDNADFTVVFAPFTLNPGEEKEVEVQVQSAQPAITSAVISIISNDVDEMVKTVTTSASIALAPLMVTPAELKVMIPKDSYQDIPFDLYNTTQNTHTWNISVGGENLGTLEQNIYKLITRHSEITALIPNRFDFTTGITSNSINDGGSNMFDVGNILRTDLSSSNALYSNAIVSESAAFGPNGKYFTLKSPGLFVFGANTNISSFFIQGGLGANGNGMADGTVLTLVKGNKTYKGFVKRVFNATTPSVNHLVIFEANGSAKHKFSSNTNLDFHHIKNLQEVGRLYYLLFAGTNGTYMDDVVMTTIMKKFIETIEEAPQWLGVSKIAGTLNANADETVQAIFNTADLVEGEEYRAEISIDDYSDAHSALTIPVVLTIGTRPKISLSNASISFSNAFVSGYLEKHINIRNLGTSSLEISDVVSSNPRFTVDKTSFTIQPNDSTRLYIRYSPIDVSEDIGELSIHNNDPEAGIVTLGMQGISVMPPLATVLPSVLESANVEGESKNVSFTLKNTGGTNMMWTAGEMPFWMSLDKTTGLVPPGEEQALVLTLDATGLTAPLCQFEFVLNYNNPVSSVITIPVTLNVTFNQSPIIIKPFPALGIQTGRQVMINLAEYFSDFEEMVLTYSTQIAVESIAHGTISGSVLSIDALTVGTTTVSVKAQDSHFEFIESTFTLQVLPQTTDQTPTLTKPFSTINTSKGAQTSINLAEYFSDIEDDVLLYSAIISSPSIASSTIAGSVLSIDALAVGATTLFVRATDLHSNFLETSFEVNVLEPLVKINHAPVVIQEIPPQLVVLGSSGVSLNLALYFNDEDDDHLAYAFSLSDNTVIRGNIVGTLMTLEPSQIGSVTVSVEARDELNASSSLTFELSVSAITAVSDGLEESKLNVYPNPVIDHAVVGYALNRDSYVTVLIKDSMGRILEKLVSEHQNGGRKEILFTPRDLSNGIYRIDLLVNGEMRESVKIIHISR